MLAEILALSNAAAPTLHYSMEARLRITVDKHLREFLRTKAQLAMPRNTEPGIMAMQANQALQFNFEQASAAASLGTSKQILADFFPRKVFTIDKIGDLDASIAQAVENKQLKGPLTDAQKAAILKTVADLNAK